MLVSRRAHRSRVLTTAALSAAAVLVLSGCNGSDGATEVDALSPVATIQKAADTAGKESATYTVELAGQGLSMKGAGAYRGGEHPAARLAFDAMKVAGFSMPAGTEVRLVDDAVYLKSSKNGLLPGVGDGSWVKLPMDDVQAEGNRVNGLDLTMADPAEQLKKMLDTQDVTKVGTETVDGAKTTHYRAEVDSAGTGTVTENKSSTPSDERSSQLEQQLEQRIRDSMGLTEPVTVDAWVDGDYHARKLMVTVPVLGGMTMTMRFADFGKDPGIEAPADAKAIDLGDMVGGRLGDALGQEFGKNFGQESGGDLGKQFADLFGTDGSGSGGMSDDFRQKLRDQIEQSLTDHGVTSTT